MLHKATLVDCYITEIEMYETLGKNWYQYMFVTGQWIIQYQVPNTVQMAFKLSFTERVESGSGGLYILVSDTMDCQAKVEFLYHTYYFVHEDLIPDVSKVNAITLVIASGHATIEIYGVTLTVKLDVPIYGTSKVDC